MDEKNLLEKYKEKGIDFTDLLKTIKEIEEPLKKVDEKKRERDTKFELLSIYKRLEKIEDQITFLEKYLSDNVQSTKTLQKMEKTNEFKTGVSQLQIPISKTMG